MVDYKTKSERVVDAAMKDGMKGLLYGLAGSTVASLALQKYSSFYKGLTLSGKVFFVTAGAISTSMIAAERGIRNHMEEAKGVVEQSAISAPVPLLQRLQNNQLELIGGAFAVTTGAVAYTYMRNKNLALDNKIMNIRLYAQGAALSAIAALLVVSSIRSFRKDQNDDRKE